MNCARLLLSATVVKSLHGICEVISHITLILSLPEHNITFYSKLSKIHRMFSEVLCQYRHVDDNSGCAELYFRQDFLIGTTPVLTSVLLIQ